MIIKDEHEAVMRLKEIGTLVTDFNPRKPNEKLYLSLIRFHGMLPSRIVTALNGDPVPAVVLMERIEDMLRDTVKMLEGEKP